MLQSLKTKKKEEALGEVLDRKATSQLIGVCLTTLSRLDIPRIKLRRRVFYKRSVVMEYLDSKTVLFTQDGYPCNQ